MARQAFPITIFNDAEGNPLSFGTVLIRISTDAVSPTGQIASNFASPLPLDVNGVLSNSFQFWANSDLSPSDAVYVLSSFTQVGQQVLVNKSVTI